MDYSFVNSSSFVSITEIQLDEHPVIVQQQTKPIIYNSIRHFVFNEEIDKRLIELVENGQKQTWVKITEILNEQFNLNIRTSQYYQRYYRVLKQSIVKGRWTTQEDRKLRESFKQFGSKCSLIRDQINQRTDTQIRYRLIKLGLME